MFALSHKEVMFITALDLGGGLGKHCALASRRTDGREEKKKLFVAAYILYWLHTQHSLGQLQGLQYSEESDFFSKCRKKLKAGLYFMQTREFALFLLPSYFMQQSTPLLF